MIPVRDNLHSGGAPLPAAALAALLLIAGTVLPGGGVWVGLLAGLGAWIWTPSIVRERGIIITLLVGLLGCGAGYLIAHGTSMPEGGPVVAGAAAAVAMAHLATHPRGRVLVLLLIPFRATLAELPSGAVACLWAIPLCLVVAAG